ncbi:translocon subunit, partial [Irineochytrium annulatum]
CSISYLVLTKIPIFGAVKQESDHMYWMRIIMGSSSGTLMEFGISPLLATNLLLQFLQSQKIISVDFSIKEERALFSGAQKLLSLMLAVVMAVISVLTGAFGELQPGMAVAVWTQLVVASLIVILLDELLQKGYGFGAGVSLFACVSICENVVWKTFSFSTIQTFRGTEYEGALVGLIHLLFVRRNKFFALKEAMFRPHLPNLFGLATTLIIFAATVYIHTFRQEIPIKSNRVREASSVFPVRLLYVGNTPIQIINVVFFFVFFISQALYRLFPSNFLVRLVGVWTKFDNSPQQAATGGLVYYISAPRSLLAALLDPLHLVVYTAIVLTACAYISQIWLDMTGNGPREVLKMFTAQQVVIRGHREGSMLKELKRIIVPTAVVGGVCIGALSVAADTLSPLGSGTGIVLAVTIVYQYFEIFVREQQENPGQDLF